MRISHGALDRPIHKDGRPQLLLVGRLPHALCRRLTLGRPRAGSRLHRQGSCGLCIGLRPGCHADKPRCNRPSNPQGRTPAAPAGRSTPTCATVCRRLTLGRPESRLHRQGSLPLALARATLHGGSDQGLGLLSGSRLSDIITALAVFGTRYDEERWLRVTFRVLRQAIPGCTEQEAQWLISHPSPVDTRLPAPQSQNKRRASHIGDSGPRHTKRSA
jgi:hypothetical protein